jgi:hypothetical protein
MLFCLRLDIEVGIFAAFFGLTGLRSAVMRKFAVIGLALGALAFAGCGDDSRSNGNKDTGNSNKKDSKTTVKIDGSVNTTIDQAVTTTGDKAVTTHDTTSTSAPCGAPTKATANAGNTCANASGCQAAEKCVGFKNSSGATVGMCLGVCCPNLDDYEDPVNFCPTPNVTNGLSLCDIGLSDNKTVVCGWACEVTDQGGTKHTYDCPNATGYECIAIFSNSDDKYCVPKSS